MRALLFRPGPLRRRLAALGPLTTRAWWGWGTGLVPADVAEHDLPGAGWVRLQVRRASVGPPELAALRYRTDPADEPFTSYPAVPGSEIVAEVVEAGGRVQRVAPGDRVVVDPYVSCVARGFAEDPCPECRQGHTEACARAGSEGAIQVGGRTLAPGRRLGAHRDLPGGWAPRILTHEDQLHPVDPGLSDRGALLVLTMARVLAGVAWVARGSGTEATERILLLGEGTELLASLHALRTGGYGGAVTVRCRPVLAPLARRLGASEVVTSDEPEVWSGGGVSGVLLASATPAQAALGLRYAARRARVAQVGDGPPSRELAAGAAARNGIEFRRSAGYGPVSRWSQGDTALQSAHRILLESGSILEEAVTHVYPMAQYRRALDSAVGRGDAHAGRVLLEPGPS